MSATTRVITVSAIVIKHPSRSELLMVRKRGTTSFLLPGGKPEAGETPADTVVREVAEELGLVVHADELDYVGEFHAPAANEANHKVTGHVFRVHGTPAGLNVETPRCLEEIEEVGWFSFTNLPADTEHRQFAPLTRDVVIPALRRRALL